MIKLSIIIPMYNVASFLERSIASTFNQGFTESEFELILVDDGSPDNSLQIAEQLTKDRPNVKIIRQENKGLGGARNTGIENTSGLYILFLDADDFLLPNVLESTYEKANTLNLDILEFGAQGVNQHNKVVYTISVKSKVLDGLNYYNNVRYMDSACNKLYRTNFIKSNSLRFLERIYIEDYEFNTRAFFYAKKVLATSSIVSHFYQTPNSITRTQETSKIVKMKNDILFVIETINEFYKDHKKTDQAEVKYDIYFMQRLSYLTTTLFYQLFKNNARFTDFRILRNEMKIKSIFFIDHKIFDTYKNMFRLLILKNFFLLKCLVKVNNLKK